MRKTPPSEWQPEILDPSRRNSDLELTEKSLWPEKRTETLARLSGADPQEMRLRPEHAGHLPVDTRQSKYDSYSTWTTCCRLGRTRSIKGILTEMSRDLELKSSEVTTKPTRYLARTQSSTCPRSHRDVNVRQMRRRCMHANKVSTDSLLENCCGLTELTCAVPWERPRQALDVRNDTDMRNIKSIPAIPPWKQITTVRPTTAQSGSGEQSSCGLSVDALGLRKGWRR